MTKCSFIATAVMVTMGLIGIAIADNSWTGFYIGANAGMTLNNVQLTSQQLAFTNPNGTCNINSKFFTVSPGIQVGYMYQFPNYWVSGIEATFSINTHQTDTLNYSSAYSNAVFDRFTFSNPLQSSIKGRLGRSINWNKNTLLPYVTAGLSLANVGLTYQNEDSNFYSKHITSPGWLVGTGVEWAFSQNLSLRAEYSYVDYGNVITMNLPTVYGLTDPNGSAHVKLNSNNIVFSVNYRV